MHRSDRAKTAGAAGQTGAEVAPARRTSGVRGIGDYASAVAWLDERVNVERVRPASIDPHVFKLERMFALVEALGNPHKSFKSVHVAGSKGKGSVCEMTASCLSACGYTTGLYTSPHLVDLRERVRINGREIPEAGFVELLRRVAAAAESISRKHDHATFFEIVTAMAFCHYAEQAVDVAVVEVGLGGRLDATNVIRPEVCAITAIQLEHTQLLGDTVEKIAREKAGIMKPGVPCLTIPQSKPSIHEVFRSAASETGCPLLVLGEDIEFTHRFEASPELGPHQRVSLTSPRSSYEHFPVPLKGEHQAFNCGLALAVVDKLREKGLEAPERRVALGLAATPVRGRMEIVSERPRVLVDGAHNPESVNNLIRAIGAHLRFDSTVIIFGCASDKDVPGMLSKLALGADKIIFTRSTGSSRAVDPRELQRRFAEHHSKMTQTAPNVGEALRIAERAVGRDDLIVVTGSFYLAGEAKRLILERQACPRPSGLVEPRPAAAERLRG
jgi:dihydrofolate synthase/folylpolyglutamate synthase